MSKKPKQTPADLPLIPDDVEAYSIAETARLFGLSTQQVRRLVGDGRLDGVGHRPTPTGLGYYVPRAAMEARGYATTPSTADEMKALEERLEALKSELAADREERGRIIEEMAEARKKAEDSASLWQANYKGLTVELDKAQALAEAKMRESYLLEQALLRMPLALGTGSSGWWQRLTRKGPDPSHAKAFEDQVLKEQKPWLFTDKKAE